MVATRGITQTDMFERMLREYHEEVVANRTELNERSISTITQIDKEVPVMAPDESQEELIATESRRLVKCCVPDCRRRSPSDCVHKMCFLCCYELRRNAPVKSTCHPHHKESLKREEEDRYIESLLLDRAKPRRLPRFFEEKFTAAGQTVTIWCLRDFLRIKHFSEETLQQEQRQFRQRALLQKRELLRQEEHKSNSNMRKKRELESIPTSPNTSNKRMKI